MSKQKQQPKQPATSSTSLSWIVYAAVLFISSFALYWHTGSFPYTENDDTIFIRETEAYNKGDNYARSFKRGVFMDSTDTYYRPMLLNSFVWDRHREGKTTTALHANVDAPDDISQYHQTNVLLHVVSVLLLFFLLRLLLQNDTYAFILAFVFAMHPALVQAVAWIPGRNDSLLAVFTFGFLISATLYVRSGNHLYNALQILLLLAALFTKETGIIVAAVAVLVLTLMQRISVRDKRLWILAAGWILAIAVWFYFRMNATVKSQDLTPDILIGTFIHRLPILLQYFGKILLPFNLCVFPWQEDTTLWFGVAAVVLIAVGIALAPRKDWRVIATGAAWFVLFILPALIVPKTLNNEIYEHRLYIPLVGVLLLLTQTYPFQKIKEQYLLYGGVALCVVLGVYSYQRCELFSGKYQYWENAVANAPSSPYAKVMLGARYYRDKVNPQKDKGYQTLMDAYAIDPKQKYLNYYLGLVMIDRNDWTKAEDYFNCEVAPDPAIRGDMYQNLARGYIERKLFAQAEPYMLKWLETDPLNGTANTNLLLLYINDYKQPEKARAHAEQMLKKGLTVPNELLRAVGLPENKQ